jgi:hypothetical protein
MPYQVFTAGQEALATDVNSLLMSQTVARFASAAARTAAIASPVLNQLTMLDSRPGFTQYWNGSAWVDAAPRVQSGAGTSPVDNNGIVTITFPVAFSAVPVVVASYAQTGLVVPWRVNVATVSAASVLLRFYNEAGVVLGINTPVWYSWIAVGLP